jgi:hypothetical protein
VSRATIAEADTWDDAEGFRFHRLVWLQTFLRLESDIPSHDAAKLINVVTQQLEDIGRHIAIDKIDGDTEIDSLQKNIFNFGLYNYATLVSSQ